MSVPGFHNMMPGHNAFLHPAQKRSVSVMIWLILGCIVNNVNIVHGSPIIGLAWTIQNITSQMSGVDRINNYSNVLLELTSACPFVSESKT